MHPAPLLRRASQPRRDDDLVRRQNPGREMARSGVMDSQRGGAMGDRQSPPDESVRRVRATPGMPRPGPQVERHEPPRRPRHERGAQAGLGFDGVQSCAGSYQGNISGGRHPRNARSRTRSRGRIKISMATSSRTWYRNSQKYLDIKSQGAGSYDLELLYVECWRNFQDFFTPVFWRLRAVAAARVSGGCCVVS